MGKSKTPPKGEEPEGSPRKKAPRLDNAARATAPVASEPNPTRESPPTEEAEGSPPKRSQSPRNTSPRRQGKQPAAAVPLPTVPKSSGLIVEVAGRTSDEKRCKCNHVITDSAIEDLIPLLKSKDAWTCYGCRREDEERIVKVRPEKSDLLICVTCYDHLCCGVGSIAYPFGHSRAHAVKKKHWFAVLYCDPERGYCFKCDTEVPMPVKFGEGGSKVALQVIRDIVSQKLLAPLPSVDSTQAQHISQSKDVVQSPLQIQEGKSVDSLTEDSISIEDFLLLFSEGQVEWCCPNCAKDHVGRFMDQSSVGRGSTLHRSAGVVEHIGTLSDWHRISGCSNVKQIHGQDSAISDAEVSLPMPFLPVSVVWNIWRQHSNDSDRIKMRFVSRLWYEYLPQKMALRPWVVGSEMVNGTFHYVHGMNLGLLKFKCEIPSGIFFSSCWDFLAMETSSGFSIWNPTDSMILKLPVTMCDKIVMQEGSDSYAFIYSSMGKFRFHYGRPVDDRSWENIVCYDRSIMDICKHENEFYAVNSFFKIHKLDRASGKMELIGPQQNSDEIRKLMGGYADHILIADLNRELIVIALGRNLQSVHLFKVVWTPEQIVSLVMVQELGPWFLFLGRNDAIALSTKDFPGTHPNTLYLVVGSMLDLEPMSIQVYDLTTRSVVDMAMLVLGWVHQFSTTPVLFQQFLSFEMSVPSFCHPISVLATSE